MLVLIIMVYIAVGIYEFVPLYKQKLWRDFWADTALTVSSFIIAVMLSLGIKIPSAEEPIRKVITSIFGK